MPMFCTQCGQRNVDDASFCDSCGAPLTASSGSQRAAPPPPVPPQQAHAPSKSKRRVLVVVFSVIAVAAIGGAVALFSPGSPLMRVAQREQSPETPAKSDSSGSASADAKADEQSTKEAAKRAASERQPERAVRELMKGVPPHSPQENNSMGVAGRGAPSSPASDRRSVAADPSPVSPPSEPAAAAPVDFYEVDAGGCRIFVFKASYLQNRDGKRTWSGACENGYAQGTGIRRTYDASGRLISISQSEMSRGRPRDIEYYFFDNGRLAKVKDGKEVLFTPSDLPEWAREIGASSTALPRGVTVAGKIGQDVTTESGVVFRVVDCAPYPKISGTRPKNLDLKTSTPSGMYYPSGMYKDGLVATGGIFPLLQEAIALLTNTCSANALRLGGTVYVFVDRIPEQLPPPLRGAGQDDIRSRSHYLMAMGGGRQIGWQIINGPSDWLRAEEKARRQAEARQQAQAKQAAAAQAAQREKQAADAAFDQFITRNKIVEAVSASRLKANPFTYEGKFVVVYLEFVEMRSASSAVFGGRGARRAGPWLEDPMLVTDVPKTRFSTPQAVIMAVKVLGTTTLEVPSGKRTVPHLKYLDSMMCQRDNYQQCERLEGMR